MGGTEGLEPETRAFYCRMLRALGSAGIPFLAGGAYAFARYTGIERHTKDFDVFVRPDDAEWTLEALAAAGCETEQTHPHWLGKAFCGGDFIDVIYGGGNGVTVVDDGWFEHAVSDVVWGVPVKLIAPEEMLWSKAFVMERERYDGADIAHLLRAAAGTLDWPRLLGRFGPDWRVLFSHLVLFGYVYPGERHHIPPLVMRTLIDRLDHELTTPAPHANLCRGTLISRAQYLTDIEAWGYEDARRVPQGNLTGAEIADWTDAIEARM